MDNIIINGIMFSRKSTYKDVKKYVPMLTKNEYNKFFGIIEKVEKKEIKFEKKSD